MKKLIKNIIKRLIIRLGVFVQMYENNIAVASSPKFANSPQNLTISLPRRIVNPEKIVMGNNVNLGPNCFLMANTEYPPVKWRDKSIYDISTQKFDAKIVIGSKVTATGGLTISGFKEIIIEDDVMFAANVYISDGSHGYNDINIPIKYQQIEQISPVRIGRGSWIGQNVVILPGVTIGEMCIIGANSVVTKSIPARTIAVGSPARVHKYWDENDGEWKVTK